jgi:hypothetical protein
MKPATASPTQEALAGLVERVTFHNAENGFCVLRTKARGHRELVTVVGHSATIAAGEWITATGEWVNDRTHGQQFKACFLRTSAPTLTEDIENSCDTGWHRRTLFILRILRILAGDDDSCGHRDFDGDGMEGPDGSVEGASVLAATEAGAPTSPICPSGALALASAVTFIPLSEMVLSTAEAVICEVSGQAKEVLEENATDSMAKPKAVASLVFIAVTPLLHGGVAAVACRRLGNDHPTRRKRIIEQPRRGAPSGAAPARGFARSDSSPNSSSPVITASHESTIAANHIPGAVRYTQQKPLKDWQL